MRWGTWLLLGGALVGLCAGGCAAPAKPVKYAGDAAGRPAIETLPSLDVADTELTQEMRMARLLSAEALELPVQVSHMLYERCADLGAEQLERARQRVLQAERDDPQAFLRSLAQRPFWQASLEQHPACAEAIAQLRAQRDERQEREREQDSRAGGT